MHRAIIIDDEQHARETLSDLIANFCDNKVKVLAAVGSVDEGLKAIELYKPDIVFLDIQMKGETGLNLLEKIETIDFSIIFTTAYDKYALHAIKFSAIDYLLKPIDMDELNNAIDKVPLHNNQRAEQYSNFVKYKKADASEIKKIAISTVDGLVFVEVPQIVYCKSSEGYTEFYLKSKQIIVSTKTLKHFEELLANHNFFRIHNSYLINLNEIVKYNKSLGGSVIMCDNTEIGISKRRKAQFLEHIMK